LLTGACPALLREGNAKSKPSGAFKKNYKKKSGIKIPDYTINSIDTN